MARVSVPAEIVLCVHEGADLRVTHDGLVSASADAATLGRELADVGATLRPLFDEAEERLAARRATAPGAPELSAFYRVCAAPADPYAVAAHLNAHDCVAGAWVRPPLALTRLPAANVGDVTQPPVERAASTPDLSPHQGYLAPASAGGIDAPAAWRRPGGRGEDVRIVDVEREWCFSHEDLRLNAGGLAGGVPVGDVEERNHGTSVAGVLVGIPNGRGIVGICPGASLKGMSIDGGDGWTVAAAIRRATDLLRPGDIMLLEMMAPGPNALAEGDPGWTPDSQLGWIPVERWPGELAAIRDASSRGVIVVSAAGNGSEDLDAPVYAARPPGFPASWRNPFGPDADSGAILVGAGAPPPGTHGHAHGADRSRLEFSNYGARVDVQAWGREVTTTGGLGATWDDLWPGPHEDRWYTDRFSGTSSAAPIVAGALACVQGVLRASGRRPLTPGEARELVRETGSPQQPEDGRPTSQRIGPRVDLAELVERALTTVPRRSGARSRPRRQAMRVTITIEDDDRGDGGAFTVNPVGQEDQPQDDGGFTIKLPQVKGPSLVVPKDDGTVDVFPLSRGDR